MTGGGGVTPHSTIFILFQNYVISTVGRKLGGHDIRDGQVSGRHVWRGCRAWMPLCKVFSSLSLVRNDIVGMLARNDLIFYAPPSTIFILFQNYVISTVGRKLGGHDIRDGQVSGRHVWRGCRAWMPLCKGFFATLKRVVLLAIARSK